MISLGVRVSVGLNHGRRTGDLTVKVVGFVCNKHRVQICGRSLRCRLPSARLNPVDGTIAARRRVSWTRSLPFLQSIPTRPS